ncbi:hypothetical protein OS493_036812 [Desmophyllum pertusum]|uniref:Uncharacterized protein n=1 Tax=Desmophyllum pertusum TaxID=174260 RepID=A0A9W9ZYZ4_9CNID|nr:hypothetical protein OS493_036812 [Desmophyllum pertusum]
MAANLLQQRVANKLEFVCRTLRFTRRRLCAVATKQQQEAHQTGVPLIIPPHVIAKAFIVHPSTTSAFDASSKYQWLTKTKLYEGLPASFSNVDNLLNDEEYVVLKEQFKKSILQNHASAKKEQVAIIGLLAELDQQPAYVIRTKQPTPLFEPDIERTSMEELPGPFDNYSLGVFRHPIVHLRKQPRLPEQCV